MKTDLLGDQRIDSLDLLHPICRRDFAALADELLTAFHHGQVEVAFHVFETYRTPMRQEWLARQGAKVTRAGAWSSAHQYGLAVDFVPKITGKWNWDDVPESAWGFLHETAAQYGLMSPIKWDKVHIEHQRFGWIKSDLSI